MTVEIWTKLLIKLGPDKPEEPEKADEDTDDVAPGAPMDSDADDDVGKKIKENESEESKENGLSLIIVP